MTKKKGVTIIEDLKNKAFIRSLPTTSELMCNVECGFEYNCYLTIYNENNCELYSIKAKDYLIQSSNNLKIINYKKDFISSSK